MLSALAGLFLLLAEAGAPAADSVIYFSAAPWDGAAYELRLPLKATAAASDPVIRVNLWGHPQFEKPTTIRFSGKEDPGGGPGKGLGRASYQPVLDRSLPEDLTGSITFDRLIREGPVMGAYELKTAKGRAFKGRFLARWGNTAAESPGRPRRR